MHIDGLLLFTFTAQANGGAGEEDGRDEGETHSDPGNHVRPVVNVMVTIAIIIFLNKVKILYQS